LLSTIQVSAVFMVVMCLFAMVFMEFFGLTKYGIYGTHNSNFRDYGNALLFLVRFTTGEAWVRRKGSENIQRTRSNSFFYFKIYFRMLCLWIMLYSILTVTPRQIILKTIVGLLSGHIFYLTRFTLFVHTFS
jgi:hypothetical protein